MPKKKADQDIVEAIEDLFNEVACALEHCRDSIDAALSLNVVKQGSVRDSLAEASARASEILSRFRN